MTTAPRKALLLFALVMTSVTTHAGEDILPLGGGPAGIRGLTLVPLPGAKAQLATSAGTLKVTFAKEGTERRFIALAAEVKGVSFIPQALEASCALTLSEGKASDVRPGLLLYEKDGGAWFKLGRPLAASGTATDARFSVQSFREAAFSEDTNTQLDWKDVERAWFGLVVDGKVNAEFELRRLVLTSAPFRPTKPLSVFQPDAKAWSMAADSAVTHKLVSAQNGPGNIPCTRLTFTFPGGRHMYVTPSQAFPENEVSAYAGLRLTYKASLPEGIDGLLVLLSEQGGGQYYPARLPAASETWTTADIPFSAFKHASWTKDANGRLDLDLINRIVVGAHGQAKGKGGDGTVSIVDIQLYPHK